MIRTRLLHDGALEVIVDPALDSAVRGWLPSPPRRHVVHQAHSPRATIEVGCVVPARPAQLGDQTLSTEDVRVWVDSGRGTAYLESRTGECAGSVDLVRRDATLGADPRALGVTTTMTVMLVVTSALLVGRMQRAMIHAGAVVHPETARAWLLVGDSGAGKSTTTATLVRAGWKYLSDDELTLFTDDNGGLVAYGWVQPFHLDRGWGRGDPTGSRATVPLEMFGTDRWQPMASVAGALFPAVDPIAPSAASAIAPADALSRLIRQSPWAMADAAVAPVAILLLSAAARATCATLRLGRDSFASPSRLEAAVRAITG